MAATTSDLPALGLDLGTFAVKGVLVDGETVRRAIVPTAGRPVQSARECLTRLLGDDRTRRFRLGLTGANAHLLAGELGSEPVLEIEALARGLVAGGVRTEAVLSLGHENMYYLELGPGGAPSFFNRNGQCAAGSGSFWYQQATRMGLDDRGMADLALAADSPVRISGRCAIFAKSDMTHAINEGATRSGVAAGLAQALAEMVVHSVAQGRPRTRSRVAVVGGVANNPAVLHYLGECCGDGRVVVPPDHEYLPARGAAGEGPATTLEQLDFAGMLARPYACLNPLGRLNPGQVHYMQPAAERPRGLDTSLIYLGVDCGSVSTKCALLDRQGTVIGGVYLPTAGRPALQVLELMRQVREQFGSLVAGSRIIACTTGSGRFLSQKTIGAEYAVDEITCQAEGVKYACGDGEDLSIIEIGGEDAKFLLLKQGVLHDYRMNPVCAAGTGTFLENLASLLGVDIATGFSAEAFAADYAIDLGDTCTLLSQSALAAAASQGLPLSAQLASLAYSAARNYLRKTAENRPLEGRIIFTGATAKNHALASAFAAEAGRDVTVPPSPELTGALGSALMAKRFHERGQPADQEFRGLDTLHAFTRGQRNCSARCEQGHNCLLDVLTFADGGSTLYGDRCGRYSGIEARRASRYSHLPDYVARRNDLFRQIEVLPEGPSVGLARGGLFFDLYPFWAAFLRELGLRVVVAQGGADHSLQEGKRRLDGEMCYPMEILVGQYQELAERELDYVFLPDVVDLEPLPWARPWPRGFTCPLLQTAWGTVTAAVDLPPGRVLYAQLNYRRGRRAVREQLRPLARKVLGGRYTEERLARAVAAAYREQTGFDRAMEREGRRAVEEELPRHARGDVIAAVFVGRPYTVYDEEASKRSLRYARQAGIIALPQEYLLAYVAGWYEGRLPSPWLGSREDFKREFSRFRERVHHIYPAQAQRMLSAAFVARYLNQRAAAGLPVLHTVLQDPFKCGPNAMLRHYLDMVTIGLRLTMDEHTAPAGMITRLEAFKNTCRARPAGSGPTVLSSRTASLAKLDGKILVPEPSPHARVFAALFERFGVPAGLLPRSADPDLSLARRHVNGDECLPLIQNVQDYLEYLERNGEERVTFFQGGAWGPCRYGLYAPTQALVLNRAGHGDRRVCSVTLGETVGRFGLTFAAGTYAGLLAMDALHKLLLATRPYEREPGSAEACFEQYAAELVGLLARSRMNLSRVVSGSYREPFEDLVRRAAAAFARLPSTGERRPRIAVSGEFYVRLDDRCNQELIRKVEQAGGEVSLSPASELFQFSAYVNYEEALTFYRQSRGPGGFMRQLAFRGLDALAHREEHRIAVAGGMGREPAPAELRELSAAYVSNHYGGEPPMTIGRPLALARQGEIQGIIFVAPFNCMPGSVVEAQLTALRRDTGLPMIAVYYDGKNNPNREEFIRSLVFQARAGMGEGG
ncbi:MAG: BadF/BadG/BcrA/BcrD ATPase family protein [bacterium]|nr:BadF/BadG/BcrA/BcrD ATPase family protein [bacterium]